MLPCSQSHLQSTSPVPIPPNGFNYGWNGLSCNIWSNWTPRPLLTVAENEGERGREKEKERERVKCPVCGEFIERTKNAIDNHRTSVLCCTRIEKAQLSSSGASLFDAFDRIPQVPIGKSINGKNPRMLDVICCSFFLLLSLF